MLVIRLLLSVVPYIGTWIETYFRSREQYLKTVVPYIGTWIETLISIAKGNVEKVVPYIGTWIETRRKKMNKGRL